MRPIPDRAIACLWILFGIVWAFGALRTKGTRQYEPAITRILHVLAMLLAWGLIFKDAFRPGPLNWLFIARTPAVQWTGVAITAIGIAVAIAARVRLGGNWSGSVAVKQDHELIQTGMYAWVRHPIYSGLVLAAFGSAIYVGRVGCLLGMAVVVIAFRAKSLLEESFMEREFGERYSEYKQRVKALIPFVW